MDYEPIKARYERMYRLADLTDFQFCEIYDWSEIEAREADQLFEELGDVDLDDYDALVDQLCGCRDIAPEPIREEYHLDDHATYHDVWREWITHKLLDSPDETRYAQDLYHAYARDLAVLAPGQPASKLGFRDWMEAQTWNMVFMVDVLNQILDDPDELSS
jgi:hypothetical protein